MFYNKLMMIHILEIFLFNLEKNYIKKLYKIINF